MQGLAKAGLAWRAAALHRDGMIDSSRPFVLLDDAGSASAGARLFADPVGEIRANAPAEVDGAFAALRAATRSGLHAAGAVAFEAGHAIEPALAGLARPQRSLIWFGLFDRVEHIPADAVASLLPDSAGAWVGNPRPAIDRASYDEAFARVLRYIAAGDIYQANLTFPATVPFSGSPLALYARLRDHAQAGWSALVHDGERWLLSFSPELFFTLEADRLTARPMKGTAIRHADPATDEAAIRRLREDPKQRAENLMIVDLLRNDLARIALPGSVEVPDLFTIETYPTVHQMTSTVAARLAPDRDAIDALRMLFPCGSVTGAPKIRAMEIIDEVETAPRGVYTGSIGVLGPNNDARFSVAIRTLTIEKSQTTATLGLGSGVIADSNVQDEWDECLAKGAFVAMSNRPFDLIETMRFDAMEGFIDLDRHIARMKASAIALGFAFDRHDCRNDLQAATFRLRDDARIRLLVARSGARAIEVRPLPDPIEGTVDVRLLPTPVSRGDFRLIHKTSDRAFYDDARKAAGTFEVAFIDEDGLISEGSFTNIFVRKNGRLTTPCAGRLLPGILRQRLLEDGEAVEGDVRRDDLAGGFFIGNALRGLIPARLRTP
jgi:para-aminobenzoate synthetase/4-amino-4-deoxychorismate lyase